MTMDNIHLATSVSIIESGVRSRNSQIPSTVTDSVITYNCGCESRNERLWLCLFHQGMEAGIDRERQTRG